MNKEILKLRNKLLINVNKDDNHLIYYESEYDKLKDLSVLTLSISDFDGNKTKHHSLNLESLICLLELLIKRGDT